jgi:hypothetical protein
MSYPVVCPLCGGYGKVPKDYADFRAWMDSDKKVAPKDPVTCHSCNGKGVIETGYTFWYPTLPYQYQITVPSTPWVNVEFNTTPAPTRP